jgi:uncharacterized SAM-binding protein YcdF (DUF218 family)
MFFTLSKILNYLTMPLVIVSGLFIISLVLRNQNRKKKFFIYGLTLLLFFSNEFIANELITLWEIPATPFKEVSKHYKYGILLSGVTRSAMEPHDRVYFQRGADRVTHSLQLYKLGIIDKILISGGSGQLIDSGHREADQIASVLVMMGVNPGDIVTENESRNTHESSLEVKSLLRKEVKPEDCLLITSAFHMRRSAACFAKVGWPVDTFSTDFFSHQRKFTLDVLFVPKIDGLGMWNALIKEWVGCAAYWVAGYI